MTDVNFKIIESKYRKKDLNRILDIYIRTVDQNTSYTSTNEIMDHINKDYKENRKLFFYNLYLNNDAYGFAEFAFLPRSEVLVIDYICTETRNQYAFYIFYKLALEDIGKKLEKKNQHIRYIITEISLAKNNGLYIDVDSNYFRKMLSIENFSLLKYPYYQPPIVSSNIEPNVFAIAIKSVTGVLNDNNINKQTYLSIIKELYLSHYGLWYEKYYDKEDVYSGLNTIYSKIDASIVSQALTESISVVHCPLFEEGQCKNVDIQPVTISSIVKKRFWQIGSILFWFIVTIISVILVFLSSDDSSQIISKIVSAISLCSGIITLFLFFKTFFRK